MKNEHIVIGRTVYKGEEIVFRMPLSNYTASKEEALVEAAKRQIRTQYHTQYPQSKSRLSYSVVNGDGEQAKTEDVKPSNDKIETVPKKGIFGAIKAAGSKIVELKTKRDIQKRGTMTTDFALKNKNVEEWEQAEFWEADPMQSNQAICDIVLYVNWEDKTAKVETQMRTNSTPGEVWNEVAAVFDLPDDTDFTRFPDFFKTEVQPLLQKIGEGFESVWNGSNYRGSFSEDAQETIRGLQEILEGGSVPTHDMQYYFSLRDLYEYGGMKQLKNDLEAEGIDILTADLNNDGVMSLAVETVTWNEGCDYKLIDVDVEAELREIQEELQEEEE